MAIPDFQTLMLPILELLKDGKPVKLSDMVVIMSDKYNLTEEERNEWLPSKAQKTMYNRVAWAKQYLKNAELIDSPEKGAFVITQKGLKVLKNNPAKIDLRFLKKLDHNTSAETEKESVDIHSEEKKTPEELIESAQILYTDSLQKELLAKLKQVDPIKFEQIVLTLMEKMNYGIGSMTPKSHDGGIDGIINEDELGLEKIYLQAKRYSDSKVNEKEMVYFIGALTRSKVQKGVFITTSEYSDKAIRATKESGNLRIKLVNGEELTKLMIKHNLGVQVKTKIEVKRLDEDFFSEE